MGNRLTRIYTRSGDDGTTALASGERVNKDCLLIQAQGDLDEMNASIACILANKVDDEIRDILITTQHHLFNIGGELSAPQCNLIQAIDVEWLEKWIDFYNQQLHPLKEFILPAGNLAIAHCHLSRTICRRTERNIVEWSHEHTVRPELLMYINRLSDLLFVLARVLGEQSHSQAVYWDKNFPLPYPK